MNGYTKLSNYQKKKRIDSYNQKKKSITHF